LASSLSPLALSLYLSPLPPVLAALGECSGAGVERAGRVAPGHAGRGHKRRLAEPRLGHGAGDVEAGDGSGPGGGRGSTHRRERASGRRWQSDAWGARERAGATAGGAGWRWVGRGRRWRSGSDGGPGRVRARSSTRRTEACGSECVHAGELGRRPRQAGTRMAAARAARACPVSRSGVNRRQIGGMSRCGVWARKQAMQGLKRADVRAQEELR
jgi:hypothetical protein